MKLFSKKWIKSKSPRKQRKYRATAPLSIKRNFLNVHLSKELKEKYKTRNMMIRKGDKVKVMRGEFKNTIGVVEKVSITSSKVYVDKVRISKKDGSKIPKALCPCHLMITELKLDDKKREAVIKRRAK